LVLTNYQASLAINTATLISASKMQADCDDIRLTDNTGQALSFYIDENSEVCNSSSTRIYFKYPQIPTSGALVYFYYGNSSARRVVNPTDETNLRPGVAHFDATAGKATAIDYLIVRQYAST